jgi:hypothetical protein
MEHLSHAVGIFSSIMVLAVPPAAVCGMLPRLGPGRAIVLALNTYRPSFFSPHTDVSQRVDDVRTLRDRVKTVRKGQYMIVSGPKGVGKTSIVDTALQSMFGVVPIRVSGLETKTDIEAETLKAITRCYLRMMDRTVSAKRVLWWHHLLFRTPVTVLFRTTDTKFPKPFHAFDSVVRELTEVYGVRVVIDASSNFFPDAAAITTRQVLFEVEPMSRTLVEQMPELKPFLKALKDAGLADVVWGCVGGNPADYRGLWGRWQEGDKSLEFVVAVFIQNRLGQAQSNICDAIIANKNMETLFSFYHRRDSAEVNYSVLQDMTLGLYSLPHKVLQAVQKRTAAPGSWGHGRFVMKPVDAATALVLKFNLKTTPSLEDLKALFAGDEQRLLLGHDANSQH